MAQQIINTGNVANDGTGESLRDAFIAVNENFTEIYEAGPVGSNVVISGNTITVTGTNNNLVLAGNGIGNIQANSSIQPSIDAVYDIGSPESRFDTVYAAYFVGNGAGLTGITGSGNSTSISNGTSNVTVVSSGGNVTFGIQTQSNVMVVGRYQTTLRGNLLPSTDGNYDLGSTGQSWDTVYVQNAVDINGSTLTSNATSVTLTNPLGGSFSVVGTGSSGTNAIAYGITKVQIPNNNGNVEINVASTPNVALFTTSGVSVSGNISATGNIAGTYFIGNGSLLTGIGGEYGNANVADFLPTYTGALAGSSLNVTGNITGSYFIGNGSQLTGLPEQYGNANVAAYLPTYTGNIGANNITASGNVTGDNLVIGAGNLYIGNVPFVRTLTVGTRTTPVTVPMASNNTFNVLGRTGNVVVYAT